MRILNAVVVAGSLSGAGRMVGLSQPTISQQLAKMEKELGAQLLVRSRNSEIELTPVGDFWFRASQDLVARFESYQAEHAATNLDRGAAIRFGSTPSLRGRFLRAAARLASDEKEFARFDFLWALNSSEVLNLLNVHEINCAVVSAESVEGHLHSDSVEPILRDRVVWVVPKSVPEDMVAEILATRKAPDDPVGRALTRSASIGAIAPWNGVSENWYRNYLPFCKPYFRCMIHQAVVELVAEGLANCHCPVSLFPNLPPSITEAVRLYDIGGIARTAVLVMPKHLLSLRPFANFQRRLLEFSAQEYSKEMMLEYLVQLPISTDRETL